LEIMLCNFFIRLYINFINLIFILLIVAFNIKFVEDGFHMFFLYDFYEIILISLLIS
jgi:hypothetical protein